MNANVNCKSMSAGNFIKKAGFLFAEGSQVGFGDRNILDKARLKEIGFNIYNLGR